MNVQDYISSGILESYVLGFCTQEEAAQVEMMMNEHAPIREEVQKIQETLELAALQSPVPPSAETKSKIWDILKEEDENQVAPIISIERASAAEKQDDASNGRTWLAYAASFALIFGASSTAIFFYSENRKIDNRLVSLEKSNQTLKGQMEQSKDSLNKMGLKMNLIADEDTKKINLSGVPTSKDSKAVVFWNERKKMVMLTAVALPQAPSDKQYQLWALVDGVPVDAGLLENGMTSSHMIEMKSIDKSQAFAITLEPKGGSVSPHLEALCVIGNV